MHTLHLPSLREKQFPFWKSHESAIRLNARQSPQRNPRLFDAYLLSTRTNTHASISSVMMSDDFSDDDVFDNIDVNEVLQSSQAPVAEAKGRTRAQQPRHDTEINPQLDDSLFDDIDADELIRSSQPTQKSQKRSSGAISDGDAANDQRKSTDADHLSTSKRQKTDHDLTPWQDTEEDKENVKLARRLLKKKFGYGAFRHEQEGAIRRVLAGENTLVIFPTGAGKSLCYQVSQPDFTGVGVH